MSLIIAVYVSSPSAGKLEMCIAGLCRGGCIGVCGVVVVSFWRCAWCGGCIFLAVCVVWWLYLSGSVRGVVVVSLWQCALCGGCVFLALCVVWWLYLPGVVCGGCIFLALCVMW